MGATRRAAYNRSPGRWGRSGVVLHPLYGDSGPLRSGAQANSSVRDCVLRHWGTDCSRPSSTVELNTTVQNNSHPELEELHCICRKPYSTKWGIMLRCRLCSGWFHPNCIGLEGSARQDAVKHWPKFVCPCCFESLDEGHVVAPFCAALTTASPCGGVNHEMMGLLNLQSLGLAPCHSHEWGAEYCPDARLLVEKLNVCSPGYAPEVAHRDLLRVRVGSLQEVALTTVGFPCEESSPLLNGHGVPLPLTKSNVLLARKLAEVLAAGLTEFIIIECDHKFFSDHSVPFQHIRAGMAAGGYVAVLNRTLSPTAFGHPQTRSRTYFAATKHNSKYELVDSHLNRCLHHTLCATRCARCALRRTPQAN